MADVLYKRYGVNIPDIGENLFQGQRAVNTGFKEALAGIGDLLKTVEQGYVDDNTTKVQEYLKSNIRSAGIGADAPTTESIKSQFGKLINSEAIDKTISSTRDSMLNDARDKASMEAGKAFGETEDIAKAGDAFKQKFLALGGRESQAADEMGKWRLDNQFRAEDVKLANADLISKFKSGVAADVIANKGTNAEEVINYSLDMLPEKLRTQAKLETRKEIEALSAMSGEQQDGRTYIGTLWDSQIQAKEAEIMQAQATAKAELDKTIRAPQSARDAVAKLNGTIGGMGEAIKNDATGSWFVSSFFNTGELEEEGAAQALQAGVDGLIDYGIPAEEAMAIGYQAYQDARAESGVRFGGVTIDSSTLDKHLAKYAQNYESSKQAENNYMAVQNAAIKERARLQANKAKSIYDFDSEAKHANISGSRFDVQDYIGKIGGTAPITPVTTGASTTPAAAPAAPTKPATAPTISDVTNRMSRNDGLPAANPGPITEEAKKPAKPFGDNLVKGLSSLATPNAAGASTIPSALAPEKLAARRGVIGGINFGRSDTLGAYASSSDHIERVTSIYNNIPEIKTTVDAEKYINKNFPNSPITGASAFAAAKREGIDPRILLAEMQQDSGFGTTGVGAKTRNPGNVGNDDTGKKVTYSTWAAGVDALAKNLAMRKVEGVY